LEDCIVYATRAKALTLATLTFKALKIQKKQSLATAACTATGEMDVNSESALVTSTSVARTEGRPQGPSSSVQSLVDKAVAAAMKKHNQNAAGTKRKRDDAGTARHSQPAAKKQKTKKELMAEAKVRLGLTGSLSSTHLFLDEVRPRNREAAGDTSTVRPHLLRPSSVSMLNRL
jgi:hypothetical protein